MTATDMEVYALERARQEAERKHAEAYKQSPDPDRRLSAAIYEILAVTTSGVLDRSLIDIGGTGHPGWLGEWPDETRTKLHVRMESDPLFVRLVVMQLHLIEEEISAYKKATANLPSYWPGIDAEIRHDEREACAKIAEGEIFGCEGTPEGYEIARLIRERK